MAPVILLLTFQALAAEPATFGLPACDAPNQQLLTRTSFVLCFDPSARITRWAAYQLTPGMLTAAAAPRRNFRHDQEAASSATSADYRNSGFHRSHLVPAGDLASNPQALAETYLLTNAVPQLPELNLSQWRRIENDIRKLAARSDAVFILTGTLLDCDTFNHIGPNRIPVPCATYKAVLALHGGTKTAYAVILDNQPNATRQTVSIRQLERRANLDFFSALPTLEQDQLESTELPLR